MNLRIPEEYAPLAWMNATPSHHKHLDRVQRRALGLISHGTILQNLSLRREDADLCYLYKLHFHTGPQQLRDMLPQLQHPISTHGYDTNNTPGTYFNSTTPCLALHQITCSGLSRFASWRPGTTCLVPYFLTGRTPRALGSLRPCCLAASKPRTGSDRRTFQTESPLPSLSPQDPLLLHSLCPHSSRKIPSCTDFGTSPFPYLQMRMADIDLETFGSSEFSIPHQHSYSVASTPHCCFVFTSFSVGVLLCVYNFFLNLKLQLQSVCSPGTGSESLHLAVHLISTSKRGR